MLPLSYNAGGLMSFIDFLTEERLLKIYNDKIMYSGSVGVDKTNNYEFKKNIIRNIKKIIRDVSNHKYSFKPYKVILIPKNIDSKPRKVCVPTIRDRLIIEALKEYLYLCYDNYNLNFGISNLITKFIEDYNGHKYSKYIKADLTTYFDLVNHKKLILKIRNKVSDELAIDLLTQILKNSQKHNDTSIDKNDVGIPQGLSISMLLANIYMLDVDNYFKKIKGLHYYRYVDDIFIFCNRNVYINFIKLKIQMFKNKLKLNKSKTRISKITYPFVFLGYSLMNDCVSVKKQSITKLENSIEKLFKNYKHNKNKKELLWRLNIRISGAICNNKKYGWLFYFNKINDLKLLYHLDDLVLKLKKRYNVTGIDNKKFIEAYYQIKKNDIKKNDYFFNVDKATDEEKKDILLNITDFSKEEIEKLSNKDLDYNYKIAVFKCLKSLEMDLDNIS